jgi:hypothetical protein
MDIEEQVCTLKHALKFERSGVKAKSYFVWVWIEKLQTWKVKSSEFAKQMKLKKPLQAYSCAELLYFYKQIPYTGSSFDKNILNLAIVGVRHYIPRCETHKNADFILQAIEQEIINPKNLKL